ncbi:zinc knuckle CX2CX4HX4C containing protein [Tanacetum coccineum]
MSRKRVLNLYKDNESIDSTKYREMIDPKVSHLEAVKRIFRYIKGTQYLGLWYPKDTRVNVLVYANSDHVGDVVDRKRTSGICTFVGSYLTSWFSKNQASHANSITESDYVAAKKDCQQALWMKQAFVDYNITLNEFILRGFVKSEIWDNVKEPLSPRLNKDEYSICCENTTHMMNALKETRMESREMLMSIHHSLKMNLDIISKMNRKLEEEKVIPDGTTSVESTGSGNINMSKVVKTTDTCINAGIAIENFCMASNNMNDPSPNVSLGLGSNDTRTRDTYVTDGKHETESSNPKLTGSNKVHVSVLNNDEKVVGADVAIPVAVVDEISEKFANTLYGYFIGERLAFPTVEAYVKNAWAKYGFERAIFRNGFFFFKFSSHEVEKGEDYKGTGVVKIHNVPVVAFSKTGLILVELFSECVVMESIGVAIPLPKGEGHYLETLDVEDEWWPSRCFHSVGCIELGEMENNVDRSKHDALNKLDGVAEGLLERIRRSRALRASESDVNPKPLKSILKRSIQSPIAKDNNGVRKVSMNPTTMVWEVETDYASPIRNADESGFQPSLTSERVGSTHTNAHENVVTADKGVSNATGLADSSSKLQGGPNANEPMADANIVGVDASDTNSLTNATKQAAGPKVNTSFASVIKSNQNKVVQITELRNEEHVEGAAVTIPLSAIEEVSSRFANTLYGYFVGKRLAFRLVENYVQNVWAKFGIKRIQLHGDFFLFQFETKEGMDRVLENGPWLIRMVPLILNVWSPDSDLHKAKIKKVPVWVKLHHVPIVAYSEMGLSLITTQIGKPIRLDAYTSNMCLQSWGRSAYARALIEVSAEDAPKEELVIAIPLGKDKEKCPKRLKEVTTTVVTNVEVNHSKDVADDGFEVVKKKKKHQKQVDGVVLNKPSLTLHYRHVDRGNSTKQSGSYVASTSKEGGKSAATSTQSKNVRLKNSFSALNDDEDNEWKDNTTWQHSQQVLDVLNESDSEVDEWLFKLWLEVNVALQLHSIVLIGFLGIYFLPGFGFPFTKKKVKKANSDPSSGKGSGQDAGFINKKKGGNKAANKKHIQGIRFSKPKSNFMYRPVSKPITTKEIASKTNTNAPSFNEDVNGADLQPNAPPKLRSNIKKLIDEDKVLDINTNNEIDGVVEPLNSMPKPNEGSTSTNIVPADVNDSYKGNLWEQFLKSREASKSRHKSPMSGTNESDEDEVFMPGVISGGGFLDDMEDDLDFYNGYEAQVYDLSEKEQAFCDQYDIRLNSRCRK